MKRGLFLSFEGGEGSGKSLQTRLLGDALRERGRDVVVTREPGGTPAGEHIREIVLHAREFPLTVEAQVLLFSAARAENVHQIIRPALDAGKIVIADRFFDSTMAYQGYGNGAPLEWVREVTKVAVGGLVPERTFVLDVPVEVGLSRTGWRVDARWDRFEVDSMQFHQRVRDAYLAMAAAEPGRFVVIAANRDAESIASDIRREVDALLGAPA